MPAQRGVHAGTHTQEARHRQFFAPTMLAAAACCGRPASRWSMHSHLGRPLALQYLLARMGEVTAPAPLPPARETALRGGAFNSAVRELLSYYISLEEYYMEESVAKVCGWGGVGGGGMGRGARMRPRAVCSLERGRCRSPDRRRGVRPGELVVRWDEAA